MRGWSLPTPFGNSPYTHDMGHHHSASYCRVMLGGEIYYRAIGRPWAGPAADFIVKFHLPELHCRGEIYYRAIGRPRGPAADFIITVKFQVPTRSL
jgi:hypothetical protein